MIDEEADKSILLHEEALTVLRRRVVRDTVQVRTAITQNEHHVEEALTHTRVEVQHVKIGRVVDSVPQIRQEGDVTIIPVVEEEVVIQRQLILKEEIHLRRITIDDVHRETILLRREDAIISRIPAGSSDRLMPFNNDSEKPGSFE